MTLALFWTTAWWLHTVCDWSVRLNDRASLNWDEEQETPATSWSELVNWSAAMVATFPFLFSPRDRTQSGCFLGPCILPAWFDWNYRKVVLADEEITVQKSSSSLFLRASGCPGFLHSSCRQPGISFQQCWHRSNDEARMIVLAILIILRYLFRHSLN